MEYIEYRICWPCYVWCVSIYLTVSFIVYANNAIESRGYLSYGKCSMLYFEEKTKLKNNEKTK